MSDEIKQRLEYLRGQLRAECVSYDELHELQSLAEHIEPGDVELLEAAGVPEFGEPEPQIDANGMVRVWDSSTADAVTIPASWVRALIFSGVVYTDGDANYVWNQTAADQLG